MVGKKFNDWVLVIFVEVQGGHWVICLGYIFFFSMGTYFKLYVQFFKKNKLVKVKYHISFPLGRVVYKTNGIDSKA